LNHPCMADLICVKCRECLPWAARVASI